MKIKVDINAKKILTSRGLGGSNKVQKHVASKVKSLSDKYTPFRGGDLMKAQIAPDGSQIVYPGPHGHYQWYGKVMAGRAPKKYTGGDLTYNGGPMRGPRWTERMMIDKRKEIENDVEQFINRG